MGVLLFLGLLAVADLGDLAPDQDAPTVGASLDKTEAHVGDRLTLTLSAVARAGIAVTQPSQLELGKLELLDRSDGEKDGRDLGDGRRAHRFVLGVTAYELGELEVPSLELSYINPRGEVRTAKTEPITLHVRPLVAEDEAKPEVQPIRPPRSAMIEDKRMMAIVTALVVPAVIRRPADEVTMEKLKALREKGNFGADGYRPFYFAVAEIV